MRFRFTRYSGLLIAVWLYLVVTVNVPVAGAAPPNGDYAPGEILVKLAAAVDMRAFALENGLDGDPQAIEQLGATAYRMRIADGTPPPHKARQLARDERVEYAEPNYAGQLPEARLRSTWVVGGDTNEYVGQWAAAKLRLSEAHAVTRGAGVTIAILDTGVDVNHPQLAGRLIDSYDFVDDDADPSEVGVYGADSAYGHGTHVAGLAALAAPEAKIMALRTLDSNGVGTIWAQVAAIRYAVEHGADVINLSYSFDQQSEILNDVLAEATCVGWSADCHAAERPGAVVVAAAGNSGGRSREYPAAGRLPGVLAVGASTADDTLASFSNYGAWVKISAPGDHVLSTIPGGGYATWSGTSMAAPLTAGTVALLRAANPWLRPADTVARITTTAAPLRSEVRRRVDAAAALGSAAVSYKADK